MNLIELRSIVVGHHGRPVLPPIDLTLRRGMFLGVIGPNGSGKTTLLRTVLRLQAPISGLMLYPSGKAPRVGYVPQRDAVDLSFPLTALEIATMGRYGRIGRLARPGSADREAALRALGDVGAGALAGSAYHALSGGQRQRVLIARALAGEPDLLLLDEPATGMDLPSERAMLDLLASFARRNIGVVMVTHHLGAVADYASELCLVAGPSRPITLGPRAEVLTSERLSEIYGTRVVVARLGEHASIYMPRETP